MQYLRLYAIILLFTHLVPFYDYSVLNFDLVGISCAFSASPFLSLTGDLAGISSASISSVFFLKNLDIYVLVMELLDLTPDGALDPKPVILVLIDFSDWFN